MAGIGYAAPGFIGLKTQMHAAIKLIFEEQIVSVRFTNMFYPLWTLALRFVMFPEALPLCKNW
jgi:hypothetical protein